MKVFCNWLFLLLPLPILSQCPIVDFTLPTETCRLSEVTVAATLTNVTSHSWDFCDGSLLNTPSSAFDFNVVKAAGAYDLQEVEENGNHILFTLNINTSSIVRLDFGKNLTVPPTVIDLGNFGLIVQPLGIGFWEESGLKYAIVTSNPGNVFLLKFGTLFSNAPTANEITSVTGMGNHRQLKIVKENNSVLALVAGGNTGHVTILNFGTSILNTPVQTSIAVPNASFMMGLDIVRDCTSSYVLVSAYGSNVLHMLSFGSSLLNVPQIAQLSTTVPGPLGLSVIKQSGNYHALVSSQTTGIVRLDFGNDLNNVSPVKTILGTFNTINFAIGFTIVKDVNHFYGAAINESGKLNMIDFPRSCEIADSFVNNQTPSVSYAKTGTYQVTLNAAGVNGVSVSLSKEIVIQDKAGPLLSVSQSGSCVNNSVALSASENSGETLSNVMWDFENGPILNGQNVTTLYPTVGTFKVKLTATAPNGCSSSIPHVIPIFPAPAPNFSLPTIPGKSCTLQSYPFTNQSTFDPISNPTWTWSVNGVEKSNTLNLNHSFDAPGTFNISLKAEIPGCSNTSSQDFLVEEAGSLVDFTFANQCLGNQTIFTNNSSTTTGLTWDFDDGQSSVVANPTHQFSSIGNYGVTLTATNPGGCENSKTKSVQIVSTPNPYFFTDLPPFSCSGTPTQFHDETAQPTDSNVTSWLWFFNDGSGATSNQKDPLHTFLFPGVYDVGLQVESNYGCVASVQLPIEIAETPSTDFNVSAACLNKPTQFENVSSPGIKSWSWMMGNSFYTFPDPVHTFTLPGSYPVSLTVNGFNNCEASSTKIVEVKPVPSLDFSTSQSCTDQPTVFTDQTTGTDIPSSWLWDFGNSQTGSGSPSSFTFTSSGAFPVGMDIVTASGCEYSLLKNVVVAPSPVASFTTTASFGPPPLIVQFTNTSSSSSSLLWEFRDLLLSTSTNQNPLFTFSEIGDYLVQLTATNIVGCSDTFSKTIQVMVPQIDLALEAIEIQDGLSGQSFSPIITVRNNSNINISGFDVFVIGSSGTRIKTNISMPIPKGDASTIVVPIELFSAEKYLCIELAALGDMNANNNSACENIGSDVVINAPYPNPTNGVIYLEAVLKESAPGIIKIFDTLGQLVLEKTFPQLNSGMNSYEVDFSANRPGLYFAIWEVGGQKSEFKFLLK